MYDVRSIRIPYSRACQHHIAAMIATTCTACGISYLHAVPHSMLYFEYFKDVRETKMFFHGPPAWKVARSHRFQPPHWIKMSACPAQVDDASQDLWWWHRLHALSCVCTVSDGWIKWTSFARCLSLTHTETHSVCTVCIASNWMA